MIHNDEMIIDGMMNNENNTDWIDDLVISRGGSVESGTMNVGELLEEFDTPNTVEYDEFEMEGIDEDLTFFNVGLSV